MINQMAMDFVSRSINESFARTAVSAFTAQLDPTLEEINDIKTSVSEAVTNCIVHGYPDQIGRVWVKVRLYDDGLMEIIVRDKGVGIADIPEARRPLFTTGGAERSGMGFTIMESFMDSLRVRSIVGKGTTVTMARRIVPRMSGR
ncbi:MAG: anti-sigma F factor [Oscillospiraceae bacterium]|nr:anti-sigma F factor [Oscillospiraceae bacterium]